MLGRRLDPLTAGGGLLRPALDGSRDSGGTPFLRAPRRRATGRARRGSCAPSSWANGERWRGSACLTCSCTAFSRRSSASDSSRCSRRTFTRTGPSARRGRRSASWRTSRSAIVPLGLILVHEACTCCGATFTDYAPSIPLDTASPMWPELRAWHALDERSPLALGASARHAGAPRGRRNTAGSRDRGVLFGAPSSNALMNLYLILPLDAALGALGGAFARFGDDILFAHADPDVVRHATAILEEATLISRGLGDQPGQDARPLLERRGEAFSAMVGSPGGLRGDVPRRLDRFRWGRSASARENRRAVLRDLLRADRSDRAPHREATIPRCAHGFSRASSTRPSISPPRRDFRTSR